MTEGIAQGDPNAQSLFVMTYEDFGQEIDEHRAPLLKMDFDVPKFLNKELQELPPDTISLHRHMYVDDHAEIHQMEKYNRFRNSSSLYWTYRENGDLPQTWTNHMY